MRRSYILKGAEPFEFSGNETGLLLLHGWTSSPSQVREMGEYLHERLGVTVVGPLCAGHGTNPEEMAGTVWRDWYRTTLEALHLLQLRCDQTYVVGLSMGGLFSLHLAAHNNVAGVVSINTPIYIWDWRVKLVPFLRLFRKWILAGEPDPGVGKYPDTGYGRIPLVAVSELMKAIKHVRKDLHRVKDACLIIQNRDDRTVRPASAEYIYTRVGSSSKELVWVEQGGHVVTLSANRREVFGLVEEFIATGGGMDNDFDDDAISGRAED